ncbi:MAG: uridine kinase [Anaerolineales bacterium]|nr:uridine kinase [Anaerolineales bacterium]
MRNTVNPLIIGIAGGTGSGKTTVSKVILERVGEGKVAYLMHDYYYKDLQDLPPIQKAAINFDHPNALDTELMIDHILRLKRGEPVEVPTYDFTTHSRTKETLKINSCPVILVEGILIFVEPKLRELFDVKLFVDTDPDIRFIRRLERDITERGRTTENVIRQYRTTVRPMHLEFVEPSKRYADVIIPEGGYNQVAMDMVIARIETLLRELKKKDKKQKKTDLD